MEEKNVKIIFEGYMVDLFLCENGNLGMTVEMVKAGDNKLVDDERPSTDIFVDASTLQVTSG